MRWVRRLRWRFSLALGLASGTVLLRPWLARIGRSWSPRVAVEGRSMQPALLSGDWVLVDPDAYRLRSPMAGELILAPDPREPERLLIKRVASVDPDGWLRIAGDSPDESTDSRTFGAVDPSLVRGRPWFRYWPIRRAGALR